MSLTKAASLYEKGCDAGKPTGCANAGRMYENGLGVTRDLTKAKGFYKQACDGSEADSCTNYGNLARRGY